LDIHSSFAVYVGAGSNPGWPVFLPKEALTSARSRQLTTPSPLTSPGAGTMVTVTGEDALGALFWSPLYKAVIEWLPIARDLETMAP
jgi:hypothetical protein